MKALKFVVVLGIIAGFAFNNANAQQKETTVSDFYWSWYVDCTGEWVTGTLTMTQVWFTDKNQHQFRWKGYMVGETSGNIYEMSSIQNYHGNYNKGMNYTQMVNFVLTLDGQVVSQHKTTYHYTYNANGELTAEVDLDFWFECD